MMALAGLIFLPWPLGFCSDCWLLAHDLCCGRTCFDCLFFGFEALLSSSGDLRVGNFFVSQSVSYHVMESLARLRLPSVGLFLGPYHSRVVVAAKN